MRINRGKRYSTDEFMRSLWIHLRSDLCSNLGIVGRDCFFSREHDALRNRKYGLYRKLAESTTMTNENCSSYEYKVIYQLANLFKRYCFADDLLTDQEREELTNVKFLGLQARLATYYSRRMPLGVHLLLQKARHVVREILGKYSEEEHRLNCQFGVKATIGCPASQAYIDEKLCKRPITGSKEHLQWFKYYCAGDNLLANVVRSNKTGPSDIRCLKNVTVPKSYKIDRGITPNTLIGTLYTSGLGKLIEQRLRAIGLDIRHLQKRHSTYAERFSRTRSHATADLSNASNMYVSSLLNRLLPREWYRAVKRGVIRDVEVSGRIYRCESIMTMGIGFTFPLQTLLFYALLETIRRESGVGGFVSVYGDDLVYPTRMHTYVARIFGHLGFDLNLDKTFAHSAFRESCGSDYFKGVNVRPFQPEGRSQALSSTSYAAFCYKILNGVLRRWSAEEIPQTLRFILLEILRVKSVIYQVPPAYPDTSGWKGELRQFDWFIPVSKPIYTQEGWKFPFLQETTQHRYVDNYAPFLWEWLRSRSQEEKPLVVNVPTPSSHTFSLILEGFSFRREVFMWRDTYYVKQKTTRARTKVRKRVKRRLATVASKEGRAWYVVSYGYSHFTPEDTD